MPAARRSAPDVGRPAASAEAGAPAGTPVPAEAGAARAAQPQPAVRRSDDADATPPAAIFAQPARARRAVNADDPDAFPELSGEVSAVVGSPSAGAPRSAVGAVSAQHRRHDEGDIDRPLGLAGGDASSDDDLLDQTVIARRSVRSAWELVPAAGTPVPLTASVVILGRRPSSDPAYPSAQLVAVPGEARTVSKTHARIEQRGDAWVVTDLGSTNGVLVRTLMGDEVEVEAGGTLDAGERFFLGDEEFHLRRTAH
ncbi:FHA domain-containing protein [Microbacterium lacticum]